MGERSVERKRLLPVLEAAGVPTSGGALGRCWKAGAALLAAWALGGILPASTWAGWAQPVVVTKFEAQNSDVAVSPAGDATIAYTSPGWDTDFVLSSRLDSGGGLTALRGLEQPGQQPQVVVAPDGTATVAWSHRGSVKMVRVPPGGVPGPVRTLASNAFLFNLEGLPDGSAVAVLARGAASVQLARVGSDGTVGTAPGVAPLPSGLLETLIARDGTTTFLWRQDALFEPSYIRARQLGLDGDLGPVLTLAVFPDYSSIRAVDFAVAPDGTVTAAWTNPSGIVYRRINPDGSLDATRLFVGSRGVSESACGGVFAFAVGKDGDAVVAWHAPPRGRKLKAARLSSTGTVGTIRTLYTGPSSLDAVAIDSRGVATVAWVRDDCFSGDGDLAARRMLADGRLAESLRAPTQSTGGAQLVEGPPGVTTLFWRDYDVVKASRFRPQTPAARLRLSLDAKRVSARPRRTARFRAAVANSGNWPANVQLCISDRSKRVRSQGCAGGGTVGHGARLARTLGARLTKKAVPGRKYKVKIYAKSPGIATASTTATIAVKKKKRPRR